jgi:serine/threonine protein kinase
MPVSCLLPLRRPSPTQNIVHSDLKARNVLLKGSSSDRRGFTAKVADFGLSLTLDVNDTHISNAWQGTMTHMAPETLLRGHISRASDAYAFGILLWELLTGQSAYSGTPRALLGHQITAGGLRPVFPPATMFEYQLLACRCWETDATIRPTFEQILEELKRIRCKLAPEEARPSGEELVLGLSSSSAGSAPAMTPADLLPPPWELHK